MKIENQRIEHCWELERARAYFFYRLSAPEILGKLLKFEETYAL